MEEETQARNAEGLAKAVKVMPDLVVSTWRPVRAWGNPEMFHCGNYEKD